MPSTIRMLAGALTVPTFLILMVTLAIWESTATFESPILLALLNTIFLCLIPLALAYRSTQSHRATNDGGYVMAAAGFLFFGLSSFYAGWIMPLAGNPNPTVTLHNFGSLLGGIFQLAGAHFFVVRLSANRPAAVFNKRPHYFYAGIFVLISIIALMAFVGLTPAFYDLDGGPTHLRQLVLAAAICVFAMSGLIYLELYTATKSTFAYWYGLALWLIAIGLACVLLQSGVGSMLGWTGRGAQYLGCLFFLFAFLQGQREQQVGANVEPEGLWPNLEQILRERTSSLTQLNESLSREISQRKQIEDALRYSEGLIRAVVDGTTDAVYIKDTAGRYLMANRATARFVGKAVEEVVGQDDTHLFPPDEARAVMNADREVLARNRVETFEEIVTTADAQQSIFISTKGPLRDKDGNVTGLFGIARDVTELRKTEARARFQQFSMDRIQDEVYWIDERAQIIDANLAASIDTGYARDELLKLKVFDLGLFLPADQWAAHWRELKEIGSLKFESSRKTRDGKIAPTEVLANYFEYHGLGYNCALVRDITERKCAEDQLHQSEERFRRIFESAADPVLLIGMDGRVRDANPEACLTYGYSLSEFIGKNGSEFVHADHIGVFADAAATIKAGHNYSAELVNVRKDGFSFPIEVHIAPVAHQNEQLMLCFIRDITERRKLEEQVRQLAFIDALTRLPNRRLLGDRFLQTIAASKRSGCHGALMFLDLDNFKPLNDAHGHEVGDELLIEVAERIKSCVREADTVSRIGGDEFVVLINELNVDRVESASGATLIAEKIRNALAAPYLLVPRRESETGQPIRHQCTVSIGVTLFSNQEANLAKIIKRADALMYKAKRAGRNQIQLDDV